MHQEVQAVPIQYNRRICDTCGFDGHDSPCDKLKSTATIQDQMFAMLEDIQRENAKQSKILKDQQDMFDAWNKTKGFVAVMKSIGILLIWIVSIMAAIAFIGTALREFVLHK